MQAVERRLPNVGRRELRATTPAAATRQKASTDGGPPSTDGRAATTLRHLEGQIDDHMQQLLREEQALLEPSFLETAMVPPAQLDPPPHILHAGAVSYAYPLRQDPVPRHAQQLGSRSPSWRHIASSRSRVGSQRSSVSLAPASDRTSHKA